MENIFPNAHGIKLWAICFAALIMAACIGAFIHSLYELWASHNEKEQIQCNLDEFEGKDCPYDSDKYVLDQPEQPVMWIFRFESAVAAAMWINGNIHDPVRQEKLMLLVLAYKKLHGEYVISTPLLKEEIDWINFKS